MNGRGFEKKNYELGIMNYELAALLPAAVKMETPIGIGSKQLLT